jgi:serine/threonine-protein kinase
VTDTVDDSTELGSMASVLGALAAAPSELLVRGTTVDEQYRIDRVLGHGAMGVVYLARDLRLEREVAIKLARERSPIALARSSREALALARLSHPNVVVIHQVGEVDGRVYVAMEHVAGVTARAWAEQPRSVREIVQLYVSVGEGLAAAHAAGLVHRDFKPDNVLVGTDGRARVADFGLARAPESSASGSAASTDKVLATGTGTVAGTPAYMAPEQYRGEDVDARADQFAFCASLWEALHRTRPFAGDTSETICAAIETGEPKRGEPERARRIPRHIERALRRGLAADREARWPSLAPLLEELRRDPARKRRLVAVGVGVPAVAIIALVLATRTSSQPAADPCAGGPARIAKLWSPDRAARMRTTIAPSGSPEWIERISGNVVAAIENWSARWSAQYRNVCEASAWTPTLHDKGMNCLALGEGALDATLETVGEPGVGPAKVAALVDGLPKPEPCSDPAYLEATVPPPTDPVVAQSVAGVQRELQRVRMLGSTGKFAVAQKMLKSLAANTHLDYPPLATQIHHAAAILLRAKHDDEHAFEGMRDVYYEARTVGDRVTAAAAAAEATLALLNLSRDPEAAQWARLAEVEVTTIADPSLQSFIFRIMSVVATDRGDAARGLELSEHALRLAKRGTGNLVASLQARSRAYDRLGKLELALADLHKAGATMRAQSGDLHPLVSQIEAQTALVLDHLGRFDEAIAAGRHALSIAEATSGPDGEDAISAIATLGAALNHADRLDEALALLDRSLASDRKTTNTYNVASDLNNRCDLLTHMKRYDDAIADCKSAIAIWTPVLGKDGTEIGIAEFNISVALLDAKRLDAARAAADRSLAILSKQADSSQAMALIVRAQTVLPGRDYASARRDLELAIAMLTKAPGDPSWFALAQLELAKVEVGTGHAAAARPLAIAARDAFGAAHDFRQAEAEQLLASLGR